MNPQPRRHWIVAVFAVAIVAACGAPESSASPPPVAEASDMAAPASPKASLAPSATPSLNPALALLQGTWVTQPVPVDEVLATVRESELSDEELADYFEEAQAETVTFTLRFLGDQMAWAQRLNDGEDEIGVTGPYWIEGGNTIVFPDTSGPGKVFVEFTVADDTLTTFADPDRQTTADRKDAIALAAVAQWFNSAPYTRATR